MPIDASQLAEKEIGLYLVYRERVAEFQHLALLFFESRSRPLIAALASEQAEITETLRTATLGWLASLVDQEKSAIDVFSIWRSFFPDDEDRIKEVEEQLRPFRKPLHEFRSNVAFHANKRPDRRREFRKRIKDSDLARATMAFLELCIYLLEKGETIPGLHQRLERYEEWTSGTGELDSDEPTHS